MDTDSENATHERKPLVPAGLLEVTGITATSSARALMWVFLLFFGFVVWKTLGQTPAFNPRLVSETIIGEGRTQSSRFMYDLGEYEFQRGYGFLVSIRETPGYRGSGNDIASEGVLKYRTYMALDALQSAVSIDPGNAHAWEALAWARARLDDTPGSMRALRNSWELAPYNKRLANRRMDLAGLHSLPVFGQATLTEADRLAISRDIDVLRRFDRRQLDRFRELYPHLF